MKSLLSLLAILVILCVVSLSTQEEQKYKGFFGKVHKVIDTFTFMSDSDQCQPTNCIVTCKGFDFDIVIENGCRKCQCYFPEPTPIPTPAPVEPTPIPTPIPTPGPVEPTPVPSPAPVDPTVPVPSPGPVEPTPVPSPAPVDPTVPVPAESSAPAPEPSKPEEKCICPKSFCWWHPKVWQQWREFLKCLLKKLKHRFCRNRRGAFDFRSNPAVAKYYRLFGSKMNEIEEEVNKEEALSDAEFVADIFSDFGVLVDGEFAEQIVSELTDRFSIRGDDYLSDESQDENDFDFLFNVFQKFKKSYLTRSKPASELSDIFGRWTQKALPQKMGCTFEEDDDDKDEGKDHHNKKHHNRSHRKPHFKLPAFNKPIAHHPIVQKVQKGFGNINSLLQKFKEAHNRK